MTKSYTRKLIMEFHLSKVLTLLMVMLAAGHAVLPPEVYWNSMLPNTRMPKAVQDLLHTSKPGKRSRVQAGLEGKLARRPAQSPFIWSYAGKETQLHDTPNVTLFFFEKNMHLGHAMNLYFPQSTDAATFLPRQITESIPFSSDKMLEILNRFSVKAGSREATMMKKTIEECEKHGIKGEEKYCATSLESMIDYVVSKLGENVKAISTEVEKYTNIQKYKISAGIKRMGNDKSIVCHKMKNYPHAVFYCHSQSTTAYLVPLQGNDGTKVKAVAVCHNDTSAWNPKNLAFQVLKVKPGTIPVCHFLPGDHIVWVSN